MSADKPRLSVPDGLKVVATLCILQSERGLLLLERRRPPHVGRFTPLGGKVDPHESPYQAALREVYEEAGIRLTHMRLAGLLTETSPARYNWVNYVYTAQVPPFDPPPCEEGTLAWVSFANVTSIPTPPTDWHIYDHVIRGQFFAFDALFDAEVNLVSMMDEFSGRQIK